MPIHTLRGLGVGSTKEIKAPQPPATGLMGLFDLIWQE